MRRWLACALLVSAAGCAKAKIEAPPTGAPHFPDFVFPAAPAAVATPANVEMQRIAWQWLQAGDVKAAQRSFELLLKRAPAFYPAQAGLGYAAVARKDPKEAVQYFDRALEPNPSYAPALAGKGDALAALGQEADALAAFEAALTADPTLVSLKGRVDALRFRGLQDEVNAARKAAEAGRFADARAAYGRAIAASPQSPFLYRELAVVDRRDGDLASALQHAQKAVEIDPDEPRNHLVLGEAYEAQGDLTKALESYTHAVSLDPNDALNARIDALRERVAFAAMPPEYKAIGTLPVVTRAQLAALIGVRLDALVKRAPRRAPGVITDTRASWAAPWILSVTRAGFMEVFPNHTFQPAAVVRRADLAQSVSRVLTMLAAENPKLAARWREASKRRFVDISTAHLNYAAVSLAVEAGVMSTDSDGAFRLTRAVTGAEAVAAIQKLQDLAEIRRP